MKCIANRTSDFIRQEVNAKLKISTRLFIACTAQVLLDKHGFTPEQALETVKEIENLCDSINRGYITFDDILKALLDDYDVEIRVK